MRSSSSHRFLCLLPLLLLAAGPLRAQPPSEQADIAREAIKKHVPGDPLKIRMTDQKAAAAGNRIKASGAGTAGVKDLVVTAPSVGLGGDGPNSGGGGTTGSVSAFSSTTNWFLIGGLLAIALGAYFQWFFPMKNPDGSVAKGPDGRELKGNPHVARLLFIGGGAAVAYGLSAPLFWVAVIGGVVLVGAFLVLAVANPPLLAAGFRAMEGARAMAEGAARMPKPVFEAWQAKVRASATEPTDIAFVEQIIQKDGLHQVNATAPPVHP